MNVREYTAHVALNELCDEGIVDFFEKRAFERKQYYEIQWHGDDGLTTAAVGATLYQDGSGTAPFAVQNEIVRQGKAREVVLICKGWCYYIRVPVAEFRRFSVTRDGERLLFQVNSNSELQSAATASPIDLAEFIKRRGG